MAQAPYLVPAGARMGADNVALQARATRHRVEGFVQLAEHHGHQLRPTGESFGCAFGRVPFDQQGKFRSGKMLQQLIEQNR